MMRTMYENTHERRDEKILYLEDYRASGEGERRKVRRSPRICLPVYGSDLVNLGMVMMILAGTGLLLSGL